jgi:hypothetical protein
LLLLYLLKQSLFFSKSIMVNLVLNDYTSKPKLPIFNLTMAMAWNIFTILLFSRTSIAKSSIDLGVRFCRVSSLKLSLDDTVYPTSIILDQPLKLFLLLTLIYSVTPKLRVVYEHWMMVLWKPPLVLEIVIINIDLSMFQIKKLTKFYKFVQISCEIQIS